VHLDFVGELDRAGLAIGDLDAALRAQALVVGIVDEAIGAQRTITHPHLDIAFGCHDERVAIFGDRVRTKKEVLGAGFRGGNWPGGRLRHGGEAGGQRDHGGGEAGKPQHNHSPVAKQPASDSRLRSDMQKPLRRPARQRISPSACSRGGCPAAPGPQHYMLERPMVPSLRRKLQGQPSSAWARRVSTANRANSGGHQAAASGGAAPAPDMPAATRVAKNSTNPANAPAPISFDNPPDRASRRLTTAPMSAIASMKTGVASKVWNLST